MDWWRKAHKELLAFSRYIVFYISKLYFYIFINVRGSRLFSNPVTFSNALKITIYSHAFNETLLFIAFFL